MYGELLGGTFTIPRNPSQRPMPIKDHIQIQIRRHRLIRIQSLRPRNMHSVQDIQHVQLYAMPVETAPTL